MNNKVNGNTLFVVGSPFQALCMLEAIDYFQIKDFDVMLITDGVNLKMIEKLFISYEIKFEYHYYKHLLLDYIPLVFKKKKKYNNFFLGNFYSDGYKAIASIYAKRNASLYYIDDGIQALEFFSNTPRKCEIPLWVKITKLFYDSIGYLKHIHKPVFFTIYDVKSTKYNIINNPFNRLKANCSSNKSRDVFIIGTNSSVLSFKNATYTDFLTKLSLFLIENYPNNNYYFCPHRRDNNNDKLKVLCSNLGFDWFDTEISVEVDFINLKIYPSYIIGFTSNALFTLHKIFPKAEINTVMYHLSDKDSEKETQIIRARLNQSGIKTLSILDE